MLAAHRFIPSASAKITDLFSMAGFANNNNYGYDIPTDTWASPNPASVPGVSQRHYFGGGVVNGLLYVFGGTGSTGRTAECDAYDPATDSWSTLASMPAATAEMGYAVLGGKLYSIGGDQTGIGWVSTCYTYDPATDTWSTIASAPHTWGAKPVCGAIGGKLYVATGQTSLDSDSSGRCAVYDPATNAWTSLTATTTKVSYASGDAVGGKLYVVAGDTQRAGGIVRTNAMQVYDPATDTWSTTTAFPLGSNSDQHAAATANGKLYVSAGTTSSTAVGSSNKLYVYDPATTAWTALTNAPHGTGTSAGQYGHCLAGV